MLNLGTQGMKRASHFDFNGRAAYKRIMDANPRAGREEINLRFAQFMESNEGAPFHASIWEYAGTNYWATLGATPKPISGAIRRQNIANVNSMSEQIFTKHTKLVDTEARRILLDTILPSGKALRDSTGAECTQAGGWLSTIAEHVGKDQIVGDALTEQDVRYLFDEQVAA